MREMPDGTRREGWVWVAPFWDPDHPIQVCALDAAERPLSQGGVPCNSSFGSRQLECGCGPNLRWCRTGDTNRAILDSFTEAIEHAMRDVVLEDRPYLDLFTSRHGYVNGPIVHFLRHWVSVAGIAADPPLVDPNFLPDLPFQARDSWVRVDLGSHHAGLLTSPAYLLRFQTDRSRASHFYDNFLCQPFEPPDGGIPVQSEADVMEPDLQERNGCKGCHRTLEPAAAHWARWGERGMSYLPPERFGAHDPVCVACAVSNVPCPTYCNLHYVVSPLTEKEAEWVGWLRGYLFQEHNTAAIEAGPIALVHRAAVDGRLPRCAASTALHRLTGTERRPDPSDPEVDAVAQRFVASGFKYRELVKAIVLAPRYRRVR
jgi:hypothetical protein